MNNFLNKIPVSPITSFGNPSVPNGATFGTNFSILQTGGYMEVYSLSGLTYTIPPATTGVIEFSGNSIPIQFTKGSGQVFSPDVLTLNSDNISSGRRKLGMLVYVYETKKIYQYNIDNYDTLWGNVTGATGPGGATVVISDFGTTVKNNTPEGQAFINAWTSSTISGIDGYDDTNASWRVLSTAGSGGAFTGGTVTGATIFTDGLTANTISAATYLNLPIIPQDYLPLSGGTVTGATIFTNGLTANTISAATYQNLPQDIFVTGGTYSDGITTLTNNSGGTFTITGYFTGNTDNYITGGTFNHNTETLSLYDLTGGTVTITGFTDINVTGGTYSDGTITFTNNTGGTFNVSGLYTGTTDVFVTGATYYDGTATFTNNTGGTFNLTGLTTPFTGGTVSGDTIFTNGLTATTISATTYQNLPKIQNVINVGLGGNVDFTSIKLAVDSVTDSSETNPYIIKVNSGLYSEDEIDLTNKPYVSIVGSSIETAIVEPNTSTQHLFRIGQFTELSFMTFNNVGVGYSAIYCDDIGDYAQSHKISFNNCDINITVLSSTQDTKFFGEYLDFNGSYSYGTKIIANNGYVSSANMENYYNYPTGTGTTIANSVQGSGATLSVFVGDGIGNGVSGSTNYQIADYASLNTMSTTSDGWGYSVRVLNVGGPSRFDIDSLSIVDSIVYDLSIEHPNTFGTFGGGSASHAKINNLSNDVYWAFLDVEDGEFDITRKISITFQDSTHTDTSTLIFKGSTMGLMSGGTISVVSGLTVNVSSGFGYLEKTTSQEVYMRIDWVGSNITLPQNVNVYLYFNENEILSTSGTRPDSVNNIVLGRVVTDSTSINFIDVTPLNADHTSNRYSSLFREALGPIYSFGSIVTEGLTPFTLDVTSGEYYFSTNEYTPTGGSGLTFNQYYNDGLGGWNISATTLVNNTQFDNNGVLSGLTSSAYTKHTLYVVGEGVNEKYFLVLGQNQYQTLIETENALLPVPPTYFNDSVVQIANIYIRQGLSGIVQIEDIRPVIGFKVGGVNASSLHANLLGLTSDDHKQYLLVDGSRAMSNNLDMGGNAIVSAGTINGVTIQSHASRHQNGGEDEIATATPSGSAIPKADAFGKLDDWISNSSSSVRGLTRLSVDPVSSTNPITVGVNDLAFLNSITGVTNASGVLSFSNVSGATTDFSGLTLNTISATTYYNLPLDVFVTGGTYSAGTAVFVNNTGSTFSVSGFSKMLWYAENTTPPTVSPTSVGLGSIVFGDGATSSGSDSFVFGSGATSNGNNLNVFGTNAGQGSVNPNNSNFFGVSAGQSSYQADNSNFLGQSAGSDAQYAKYSNFFGYQVGSGLTGSNNIIIGTNITLPNSTYNAINLGNVLFGINTYSGITGTPNADPTIDGKIGIGVVTPLEKLHVGGNTLVDGGLTATTISATTYLNIPNTAFTGGTVTGGTRFTNGLTANTISASTYNLNTINNFSLVGNGNITISGGTSVTRRNENNSTNDAINYCGIALGTNVLDSAAAWTITRITVAVDGSVTTAISAVNSIWNNRESISYT